MAINAKVDYQITGEFIVYGKQSEIRLLTDPYDFLQFNYEWYHSHPMDDDLIHCRFQYESEALAAWNILQQANATVMRNWA